MGCCQPVLAPIENYYTKWQVDDLIEGASGCCITEEEVDEKIESAKTEIEAEIPSLSGYATEQWVQGQGYITGVDLSNYATKSEIPVVPTSNTAFTNDAGYLTEHQPIKTINGQSLIGTGDIEIGTGGTIDLSNYYTTAETKSLVESAVTVVEGKIPTIPTSNTAFTNDAGYLTEHQSLTAYSTTNEVNTLINQAVSGKQDTLSAGTNITIVDNVISATNGGSPAYSASSGINISNNEISTKVGNGLRYTQDGTLEVNSTNAIASGNTQVPLSYVVYNYVNNNCMMKSQIWCGTQAEYDAITTKDNNVIYLIYD
jgi:hypothetical protein